MKITALPASQGSKAQFGVIIKDVDLNDLDDATFDALREAIYIHSVVVIKGQQHLDPIKQFEFSQRMDPNAPAAHGFPDGDAGVLDDLKWYTIPGTLGVQLIGDGYQGKDHYGLKDITMHGVSHASFQADILSDEEISQGDTRFGIIYGAYPSRVTSLRSVRVPKGPPLRVRWDDGSGKTMSVPAGSTAFFSNAQLYSLLTEDEKLLVDHSYWEPAPHPFVWTGSRKTRTTGLGLSTVGEVRNLEDLPTWTPDKVFKFPMVWLNPVTGAKGFQVRAEVVRKLYLRRSPEDEFEIVEDLEYIGTWLNDIVDRILSSEYIIAPSVEEGDVVIWNNWGVMHSSIEYPSHYGVRTVHQCHIASSTAPPGLHFDVASKLALE